MEVIETALWPVRFYSSALLSFVSYDRWGLSQRGIPLCACGARGMPLLVRRQNGPSLKIKEQCRRVVTKLISQ